MTAPTPNAALAYQVLDQLDAHPELHRQGWWFTVLDCGTAGCFAGWGSVLSGDRPRVEEAEYDPDEDAGIFSYVETADGSIVHIEDRALNLFGITPEQGKRLFDYANTREHLGELVAEIFGPRPEATA